ncbi:MAG: VTT domain-containing protein [Ignavibacteriales bacterium]|nr:MAG: hypothetical protein F9K26_10930 [Ignavibacteriaceae bacterium]MBW7874041.1 VTT domain-containing protein [Ignavibacteria bacterium]MCZ2143141.1 VTT domain-containing protein [Ignavibacteriales bacterium]OQY74012.1 MAG: hypothetical protein B6D45_07400 [Ignavibacteriales bacterium UTCHB3]MBV6444021.1 Protein DedA [Ignavibacteriaceae bacterium]
MEFLNQAWEVINHLDKYLEMIAAHFGRVTYIFLFLLIFLETNFVLTPILPGVTIIFAAGALAAVGMLNIYALIPIFIFAVFFGDILNYVLGRYWGEKAYKLDNKFIRPSYLKATEAFFDKHGRTTMFLARYFPLVRTFAPLVAGIVKMKFVPFLVASALSAAIYITIYTLAGYFFGSIPFVKDNLTVTLFVVAFASVIPMIYKALMKYLRHKKVSG